MDIRDFTYWLKLSIYTLSGEIYTQSMLNNLSFSDEKGFENAIKRAREFRIIDENVFDIIDKGKSPISDDNRPWNMEVGWKSRESYRQMLGMLTTEVNQNFKSIKINNDLLK